jgi:hypothetical protein
VAFSRARLRSWFLETNGATGSLSKGATARSSVNFCHENNDDAPRDDSSVTTMAADPCVIPNGGGATEEGDDEAEDENGDHSETGAEAEKAVAACVRIVDIRGLCSSPSPSPLLLLLLVTETAVDDEGGRVDAGGEEEAKGPVVPVRIVATAAALVATGVVTLPKAPCGCEFVGRRSKSGEVAGNDKVPGGGDATGVAGFISPGPFVATAAAAPGVRGRRRLSGRRPSSLRRRLLLLSS